LAVLGHSVSERIATLFLFTVVGNWLFSVNMSESQQKKPDLGLLEEDDEFEEFPAEGLLNLNMARHVTV